MVTDEWTDGRTDIRTDRPSDKDARTDLKKIKRTTFELMETTRSYIIQIFFRHVRSNVTLTCDTTYNFTDSKTDNKW